jgi:hypothetical protein
MKNKIEFKNTFYLFHNWVNAKKRKPLFNYGYIGVYGKYNLINVVNHFLKNYQTKGNMKLINESFQRQLILKDFKNWFTGSIRAFIPPINIPIQISTPSSVKEGQFVVEENHNESNIVVEEKEQQIAVEENHIELIIEEKKEKTIELEEEQTIELNIAVEEEPIIVEENHNELNIVSKEEQVIIEEEEEEQVIIEEVQPVIVEEEEEPILLEEEQVIVEEEVQVIVEEEEQPIVAEEDIKQIVNKEQLVVKPKKGKKSKGKK